MRISVIIPVLNEESNLGATIDSAAGSLTGEVIVVDGGSRDASVEVAASRGAAVLTSPRGRARQMNTGAAAARGDVLLFLHADTLLPPRFDAQVQEVLSSAGTVAGAFRLRIDSPQKSLRLIERFVNWRSTRLQMPYGDQALFLPAEMFRAVGGFPDLPIMEDFEMMLRLRRRGRIRIASGDALTSARRWQRLGVWKTTLINQAAIAAYAAGVNPARIARWYHGG